jgi:hypothetical protein
VSCGEQHPWAEQGGLQYKFSQQTEKFTNANHNFLADSLQCILPSYIESNKDFSKEYPS